MARQPHHKLIRDRIPDILNREGVPFAVQPMSPEEYRQALRQKLVEEAIEAATADQADLVTELADLLEVIDATLMAYNLHCDRVLACQAQRRTERGGFQQRLKLLWTEIDD
jgi:predicted house-cleaning noncanonical NTP pyrophosphatase (MazG superfamily)